jgi:hypothetical protein
MITNDVIYKYLLDISSKEYSYPEKPWIDIELPAVHHCLSVVSQNGMPYVYAVVDSKVKETVGRRFYIIHTGDPIPGGYDTRFPRFLGTCLLMQKQDMMVDYVVHVFEGQTVKKTLSKPMRPNCPERCETCPELCIFGDVPHSEHSCCPSH